MTNEDTFSHIAAFHHQVIDTLETKGYTRSSATFQYDDGVNPFGYVLWYRNEEDKEPIRPGGAITAKRCEIFAAPTYDELRAKVLKFVWDLPSSEEILREQFTKSIANALEIGKRGNFPDMEINPLVAMMEKLSGNALTKVKESTNEQK